jgi:hypothetical protein
MQRRHPAVLAGMYGLFDITLAIRLHAAVFSIISTTPVNASTISPRCGIMESVDRALLPGCRSCRACNALQAVRDIERHSMELRAELKTPARPCVPKAQGVCSIHPGKTFEAFSMNIRDMSAGFVVENTPVSYSACCSGHRSFCRFALN